MVKSNDGTNHLSHSDSCVFNGHAQEARYIESTMEHHFVKVFSSRESTGLWRATIRHFLADRYVRTHECVLTRPVTRGMRQLASISFYPRTKSTSLPLFFSRIPVPWSLHRRSIIGPFQIYRSCPRGSSLFHIVSTSEWRLSHDLNNYRIYIYEWKWIIFIN